MILATFDHDRVGIVKVDKIVDVTDAIPAGSGSAMLRLIRAGVPSGGLTGSLEVPLADMRLQAPLSDPSKILAAPVNYRKHQSEMDSPFDVNSLGMFLKAPSSIIGDGGTVRLPYSDRRFDQEGELAVVIGKTARHIREDDALDVVFGYTALLDITMRGTEDRSTRKSFETFTPIGPWIVTADSFGSPGAVSLECDVSGVTRQRASTSDLIWNVPRLIEYASSVTTLHAGDIIATGTPEGVGSLEDGDEILLRISGLGRALTVRVVRESAISVTSGFGGYVPTARSSH